MQDAARQNAPDLELRIIDVDVEQSTSTSQEGNKKAVEFLRETKFRYFFLAAYSIDEFMEEAYRQGVDGTGVHNWIVSVIAGDHDFKNILIYDIKHNKFTLGMIEMPSKSETDKPAAITMTRNDEIMDQLLKDGYIKFNTGLNAKILSQIASHLRRYIAKWLIFEVIHVISYDDHKSHHDKFDVDDVIASQKAIDLNVKC